MNRNVLKRPAGAAAVESPAKRQAIKDPTPKKCSAVMAVIPKAEDFPESVRNMLQAMGTAALSTAKNERHAFQATVAEMVGEVLKSLEAGVDATIKELQPKLDGCEADRVARQEALASAEANLTACKDNVSKQEAVLEEANGTFAASKKSLAAKQKAQVQGEVRLQEAEEKKKKLEEAKANLLEPAKIRPAETAEVKVLVSLGSDFGFDPSFMQALPSVLKKEPASRAGFDLVTMEQLEQDFTRALGEQSAILEEGSSTKAQLDSDLEAERTACDEASAKHKAATEALEAAKAAVTEGEAALDTAQKAVANYFPDTKAMMDEYDKKKAWLTKLREGPLAAFKELYERETQPEAASAGAEAEPKTA